MLDILTVNSADLNVYRQMQRKFKLAAYVHYIQTYGREISLIFSDGTWDKREVEPDDLLQVHLFESEDRVGYSFYDEGELTGNDFPVSEINELLQTIS